MEIGNRRSRLRRTDVAAFAVLLALTVTLPALYVSAERVVYSSDYAGFQDAAVNTALELRERLASGVHATLGLEALVWRSTGWDYSLFPAVLPAPLMLAVHGGRVAYIVTCSVLYLLPFVLLLGATAAMLATLIALALVAFLRDMRFERRSTAAAIGVSLAVAILFRRHFAYPALSLLGVIGVHTAERRAAAATYQIRSVCRPRGSR